MTRFLIRCYPGRWRERYGDEFEALLDERSLGPFDVADILLGALDARLRMRGRRATDSTSRSFTMTLRVGGIAAILGVGLLLSAAISTLNGSSEHFATLLAVAGMFALLVAIVGVSAFQARTRPRLVWTAFGLCAFATISNLVGVLGLMGLLDMSGPWQTVVGAALLIGLVGGLVGFSLFGIATLQTGVLSRFGAILLAVAPVVWLAAVVVSIADWGAGWWLVVIASLAFLLGWLAIGIAAIRLDQPATTLGAA